MGVPVVGSIINWVARKLVSGLLDKGIIEFKDVMLDYLGAKAREAYAPQIAILREAQNRDSMTEEEEREFEKRLQEVVKHRPGIVRG